MNKKERIKAAIEGAPVDKIPYSFWSHFPKEDLDSVKLARKTYDFYKEYDIDFVKTMNNGMYSVEDFGCIVDFSQIENGGVAKIIKTPINSKNDWSLIKKADISQGTLKRELDSLKLLKNY